MTQPLVSLQDSSFFHYYHSRFGSSKLRLQCCLLSANASPTFSTSGWHHSSLGSMKSYPSRYRIKCRQILYPTKINDDKNLNKQFDSEDSTLSLHVQTLSTFPNEKLREEVIIVRFDSSLLLQADSESQSVKRALSTIKFLYSAKAKVLLISNWGHSSDSVLSMEALAGHLSSALQINVVPASGASGFVQSDMEELSKGNILLLENLTRFREEVANCSTFSEKLSSGAAIFVNDAFSLSHKILASNVGVPRFCYASVAGFHFAEELVQLMKTREITRQPYIAIIGGSNFLKKSDALHLLASICDGLIFVGMLSFQVMHALGQFVPSRFLEMDAVGEAVNLIHIVKERNIPIYFPNDLRCVNNDNTQIFETFPSNEILTGWTPVDLGPISLKDIYSLLSECKKVLWIGPVKYGSFTHDTQGATQLALMLEKLSKNSCDVTIVGRAACKAASVTSTFSSYKLFENASVVWEFLKGRPLPGVAALDRAFPNDLDWDSIFIDPTLPLVVDIGSGNGLFLLQLSTMWKDRNFIGLEINKKLVKRCQDNVHKSGIKNAHFISTNATSTFRSIVSSYPGHLILVTIQCPDPDFNREDHRWRMVQRTLVESIVDLLKPGGKIFLQSDIEAVTTRMKLQFMMYGKAKLLVDGGDENGWLEENPFGVQSDWEQHVIDRGAPMHRLLLQKIDEHDDGRKGDAELSMDFL